jgi:tricorn protease
MMSAGFAEFHRYFIAECDRDGLIVDVRYNRGGHVSQLLLEKVARKRIGYATARWGQTASYPEEAVAGPVVALTNEHSGSDGDIFSHGFKLMGIGPLVGMRTWGGVIGIYPRHTLVDGTQTTAGVFVLVQRRRLGSRITVPTRRSKSTMLRRTPSSDRQLETAVATHSSDRTRRFGKPHSGERPNLWRSALPPRG